MNTLSEKIAIVTGGAGDIGRAIVFKLATEGFTVVIFDLDDSKFDKIKKDAECFKVIVFTKKCDVSSLNDVESNVCFVKTNIGFPSVLVNCAGIRIDSTIFNMSSDDFDKVIDINLKGTFNCIKALMPIFKEKKYGKVVNISSINAFRGKFGQANYTSSKAGVNALTKTAAIELGKYNVNVNAVAPGMIKTNLIVDLKDEIIDRAINESLFKRLGDPEDVAELVSFLVSDKSRHITGEIIKIDGGQYL